MTANITPEVLSAHDHGNCELCDEIERKLAAALEENALLRMDRNDLQARINDAENEAFNAKNGEARALEELARLKLCVCWVCLVDELEAGFWRFEGNSDAGSTSFSYCRYCNAVEYKGHKAGCKSRDKIAALESLAAQVAEAKKLNEDMGKVITLQRERRIADEQQLAEANAAYAALKGHAKQIEREHRDDVRDAAAQASHAERYPDEPYGTY